MQPDVRLSLVATCLVLTSCGGDTETTQAGGSAGQSTGGSAGIFPIYAPPPDGSGTTGGTAGSGGTGGVSSGGGGVGGTTGGGGTTAGAAGMGGIAGTGGKAGAGGTGGIAGTGGKAGAGGTGGAVDSGKITDAAKEAGASCYYDSDCLPTETCSGAINCPPGAFCILAPQPGKCVAKTPTRCSTSAECGPDETCVQTMFPIFAPMDARTPDAAMPKLGECRPKTQALLSPSAPTGSDAWWGAAESALRGS